MDAENNINKQLSAKARLKRKNILYEKKNIIKNATKCPKQQKMNLDRSPTENASQETKTENTTTFIGESQSNAFNGLDEVHKFQNYLTPTVNAQSQGKLLIYINCHMHYCFYDYIYYICIILSHDDVFTYE